MVLCLCVVHQPCYVRTQPVQIEIEKLKSENDRLKLDSHGCSRAGSQVSISSSPHHTTQNPGPGPGLSEHSLNLTTSESTSLDMLLDDTSCDGGGKEGGETRQDRGQPGPRGQPVGGAGDSARDFLIGCIGVSGKTKWDVLDGVVRRLFKEYVTHVDPSSQLGLSTDSVEGYRIGDIQRLSAHGSAQAPELLPCGYLVGDSNTINIRLKDVNCDSVDSLVFDTLIQRPVLQRYVSLLRDHRRIILSGPSGTGKTFLAHQLSRHLLRQEGRTPSPAPCTPSTWTTSPARSCGSTSPAWRISAAGSRRQRAPWWSSWITCTTSAPWGDLQRPLQQQVPVLPVHHRHHEPGHVLRPQPPAAPQLQVGAVCQPPGAGERLPGPLPAQEADRDGDRQPLAQPGAGEGRRLDAARVAPPQPLPGGAQLLRRHHRPPSVPLLPHGRGGLPGVVHRPVELLHHPLHAGSHQGGAAALRSPGSLGRPRPLGD
ncbi:uncharacterized protein LOC132472383 [Gadus macrocephalus]|uniref:uncharacterized protein LOC132472383 n=1 Tax=Gadus macrocephalus TaxID=80720 RepID=UPI0028CBAED1|nr:uncharacterized protein LOC132472383 [Gadus macrocephalus]